MWTHVMKLLILLAAVTAVVAVRQCPVFQCIPKALQIDFQGAGTMFDYNALIAISQSDDVVLQERSATVKRLCVQYKNFDDCFGGRWWECFDLGELLKTFRMVAGAFGAQGEQLRRMEGLSEGQVHGGLEIVTAACGDVDAFTDNTMCIRDSIVFNKTVQTFVMRAYSFMARRPQDLTCDRINSFMHVIINSIHTNCGERVSNYTYVLVKKSYQAMPTDPAAPIDVKKCDYKTFEQMRQPPTDEDFKFGYHEEDGSQEAIDDQWVPIRLRGAAAATVSTTTTTTTTTEDTIINSKVRNEMQLSSNKEVTAGGSGSPLVSIAADLLFCFAVLF